MTKYTKYLLFTLLIITVSCNNKQVHQQKDNNSAILFADGFTIDNSDKKYTKLTVLNPWDDYKTHSIYYLVKDASTEVPNDGVKIKTPIKRAMVNSATYLGFLELIDELDRVVSICNTDYIYNEYILNRVQNGSIKDVGDSYNLNMEQLIMTKPNVVFTTAFNGSQSEADNFNRFKLQPVFGIEWQESSVLGRAEWIKFIAAFFDKQALADQIFNQIVQDYQAATKIAQNVTDIPTILSGEDFRGTWSMPAGNSYFAQLIAAAHIDYYYKDDTTHKGSIPATIEEALIYFYNADLWVNTQAHSLSDLAATNNKYTLFKAYKNKNVYNNNKRSNAKGGNDYWEMGVARPDLLLKDLIKAAHPNLLSEYEFTYMQKLQ